MTEKGKFLKAKEVSKLLGILLRTIHRLSKQGKIKSIKVGGRWLYPRSEMEKYLSVFPDFSSLPVVKNAETSEKRENPRINCYLDCNKLFLSLCEFAVIIIKYKNVRSVSMKRILITGGAGFIGSHLCDLLLKEGFGVICMDNLITGSMDNILHLIGNPNFKFVQHDVSRFIEIDEPINYVMHFASPASPVDYLNFPIQTLKVGSLGTHNALGVAKLKGAVFMLASTSEVYGDPLEHPQKETYWGHVNCIGPRGVYDESKRFAEAITMAYHKVHKLEVRIVRIFNTYGPRMRISDGRAIPNFIGQALRNEPVTVYGDGSQTRSFCYVSDLASGLHKLLMSNLNEPVNLGNPVEMSLLDMANEVIKLTRTKSKIVFKPLPVDDPKVRCPDITKAKKFLGWEPKVKLGEGLRETIKYFKKEV